ncbi:cytochrome P450 [Candidatus Chloroploca sp. M-50]|uniref:Cytochrome P450 n=1 Tax=Candidatus Chloroploca mongolica TaxID=2528176 RepID=A0ABS4DGS3_9CHLR|nr:cytochrome P450 [Candidatus Chloroploca mongolica]MBP1468646.1 cytochrome P450 [Candidatus Chloroploca mongolica]
MSTTTTLPAPRRASGPRAWPPLGVLPAVRRDSLSFLMQTFREYGDVAVYWLGPLRSYLVSHPDGVHRVLQEHAKIYTKDHLSYGMIRWLVGDGLLTSQGETWLRQRRLAQPAFHRQRLAALAELMVTRTEAMLNAWEPAVAAGRPLEIGDEMMRLALGIVGDALFGSNVEAHAAAVSRNFNLISEQFIDRFRSGNVLSPVLPTQANRAWKQALRELDTVVYAIIAERRRNSADRGDLLSMLMLARDEESGVQMDDQALRNEVMTMLIAGHETTATLLTWACGLLAAHPEAAARLEAELATVLGGRAPSVADLPQLSYTRMVLDETLRLYPPVYILSRKVVADDEVNGYRIPKGSSVDLSPYVTHRHPAFWPDPERFDPERFTPAQVAQRHKQAYFPFSAGPRICIGNNFALMEATLVLASVARRYRLRLTTGALPAAEPLITLRPKGGMPMRAELR